MIQTFYLKVHIASVLWFKIEANLYSFFHKIQLLNGGFKDTRRCGGEIHFA
jgi:hypothetical protein